MVCRSLCRLLLPAATLALLGLSGCVAYPAYDGYYAAPAAGYVYAPAPRYYYGGGYGYGYGRGWGHGRGYWR
ncbi:hypothetical protein [Limobrevibacterium gyesilva]|uniref:Lipoprotein n=1 Tax=Limobrevibacterium gyesilva TaxID=2991712 RepID=A0AA41YNW1_9PROT|nr:hypothetical protein [Limobrevibacterium gyesilva]MCW3477351.1 hypothetical protein [Limobrevibacterium gyesilva]